MASGLLKHPSPQQHIMYMGLVTPDSPVDFAGNQLSSYIPSLMSIPVCDDP